MTTILADIGGTHARLALDTDTGPQLAEKVKAADYAGLEGALADFCAKHALDAHGRVAIGTAAHPDAEGVWRFQNLNEWGIDARILKDEGWDTVAIVNDFVASSLGAVTAPDERLVAVRGGSLGECSRFVVLGPGTGLGLGFVERLDGRWHVQETLGGHMYGACATDEQYMVSKVVRRLRGGDMMFIHEDVCSGVGLPVLYKAVCLCSGQKAQWTEAADIITHRTDPMAAAALRLFHEFLGLFAHNALVTGHAFGGVYLDGGLTQHLAAQGAFDRESFLKYMTLQAAEVVQDKIDSTPVFIINDPFVALQGLSELVRMHG
jgi:glucokinase